MSLEQEIKELRLAVLALTEVIIKDVQGENLTPVAPIVKEEAPEIEEVASTKTTDDLTQLMIKCAKAGKKDESRTIMREAGYKKMSEIPTSEIDDLFAKVEALL